MKYLKVKWHHNDPNDPVLLFSELDSERWETRKVEIYRDGSAGNADKNHAYRSMLGLAPIPALDEINAQPEFEANEITRDEFEKTWASAKISNTTNL